VTQAQLFEGAALADGLTTRAADAGQLPAHGGRGRRHARARQGFASTTTIGRFTTQESRQRIAERLEVAQASIRAAHAAGGPAHFTLVHGDPLSDPAALWRVWRAI
jgi:hypothetical protein